MLQNQANRQYPTGLDSTKGSSLIDSVAPLSDISIIPALVLSLLFIAAVVLTNSSSAQFNSTDENTETPSVLNLSPNGDITESMEVENKSGNSMSVQVQSQSVSSDENVGEASVSVKVNGQDIPVPENGSLHQTIPEDDGSGAVHLDIQSSTSSEVDDDSRTRVRIRSDQESEVRIRQ